MSNATEQALVELQRRYDEEADRLAEELQQKVQKATNNASMYRDVYDGITSQMEWVYQQLDEISTFKNLNAEQQAKVELVKRQVVEIETNLSKMEKIITELEEQAKQLTDEHKQILLAKKIASYKEVVKEVAPIAKKTEHKGDKYER